MAYTETSLVLRSGGRIEARGRAPFAYAEDKTFVAASTSTTVMLIDVAGMDKFSFMYVNAGSTSHVVKIYGSQDFTMPTSEADTGWKQIGATVTVTNATTSEPQVYDNVYCWVMVDVKPSSGAAVTTAAELYFYGKITPV